MTYGGVVIDNISKSRVRVTPMYNTQGTTVKYNEYVIDIEAIVDPNYNNAVGKATTEDALEQIRSVLLTSNLAFEFLSKGLGDDWDVRYQPNQAGREDVTYGPRPVSLTFEPIHANKGARIVWTIVVNTPECLDQTWPARGLCEFWCTSSVNINRKGYQTLTRTGYLELMGGTNTKKLKSNAQASKLFKKYVATLLNVQSMQGYHLEQSYDFSPDDRSCNFTLTYTEIESDNAYPNGVVEISCEHDMGSNLLAGDPYQSFFKTWTNTMSCQIELRPKTPKLRAWAIFATIASQRISQGIEYEFEMVNNRRVVTKIKVPLILSIRVHEDIFAHTVSFDIVWVSHARSLGEIFRRSGMFKKVSGTDWDLWTADVRGTIQNPDGAYPLLSYGVTQAIIDPCSPIPKPSVPDTTRDVIPFVTPGIFRPECPPAYASWIDYKNKFIYSQEIGVVDHRRYKDEEDIKRITPEASGRNDEIILDAGLNTKAAKADFYRQDFGSDIVWVTMKGFAIRLGRPTKPPILKKIGGKDVQIVPERNEVTDTVTSSDYECPTYVTTWEITYEVLGYPKGDVVGEKEATDETNELR